MTEEFKDKEKQALGQRIVENSDPLVFAPILQGAPSGQPSNSSGTSIDLEQRFVLVDLRGAQVLKGWQGIFGGIVIMIFGALLMFQGFLASSAYTMAVRICVLLVCTIPALVGLAFFCSGANSFIHKRQRQHLRPGRPTWEAEFKGDHRFAANQSPKVARKYFVNFLIGNVVLVPGLYLGWTKVFENFKENSGIALITGAASLWYLVAAALTMQKFSAYRASRKLSLVISSFPFFLGQNAEMALTTSDKNSTVQVSKVILRCIREETVVREFGDSLRPRSRTASRQAIQLYGETRSFAADELKGRKIPLVFQLPNKEDLNTSLLCDDPVYWSLSVEGYCDHLPINTSFLLPVYKKV
jgi:hypothetical protein